MYVLGAICLLYSNDAAIPARMQNLWEIFHTSTARQTLVRAIVDSVVLAELTDGLKSFAF